MAVAQRQKRFFTPEEYLTLEEKSHYRSEYYKGEIFAMSGGSANHNRIVRNVLTTLDRRLEGKPCEAFVADMRLQTRSRELYTYPDVMVVCGELKFVKGRTDTITNPTLIVEVASPSTASYDRGEKFELYRSLDSFQEYVLIDQDRIHVEIFYRSQDRRWELTVLDKQEDDAVFQSLGLSVRVNEIYRRVMWEQEQ